MTLTTLARRVGYHLRRKPKVKVVSDSRLKDLEDVVKKQMDSVIKERMLLGRSCPQDYFLRISFYNGQNALAQAEYSTNGIGISINVLPFYQSRITNKEMESDLSLIGLYFDITRDFLVGIDERYILSILENPELALEAIEKQLKPEDLDKQKKFFELRGMTYESYKQTLTTLTPEVKKALERSLPTIKEAFKHLELTSLRHELDHLDFFSSPMYKAYAVAVKKAQEIKQKMFFNGEDLAEQCAIANMDALQIMSEIMPLTELRALFFTHIPFNKWSEANLEEAGEKVYKHFDDVYIGVAFPESILDKIISQSWATKEMDRETSNYLFRNLNDVIGSPNAMRYVVDVEKVNYPLSFKVFRELKDWQERFRQNARTAVDAFVIALKEDPSRMNKANKATTFQQYIADLKGEK